MYKIISQNLTIDALFGSRYIGGKIQHRKHFLNDIAVRINTLIFNFLFAQSITDLHSGSKIMKSKILEKINLTNNDFGLEIDLSAQIVKKCP